MGDLDHEVQVPTDNASSHAIALAARHDARLHFLYVISSRKYDTSIQSAVVPLEEEGEAILEHLVEASERAGVETVRAVEVGPPIRTIAEYVGEQDIDLVVVNERGHRGVVSRILGSLSERLAAQVDVEIRTVPSGDGL